MSQDFPFPARDAVRPDRPFPDMPASWRNLGLAFTTRARSKPNKRFVLDTTGAELNYRPALEKAGALARVLLRVTEGEPGIGLLVPPSVGGAVANVATALSGKWSANLNYAAGDKGVNSAIKQCGLKKVITSRAAFDKLRVKPDAELIYLEDLKDQVTDLDKAAAMALSYMPLPHLLSWVFPGLGSHPNSMATVLFSSGSTGEPKGIMLSHRNILSNAWQVKHHGQMSNVVGFLPFGHSFGLTITLWTVAALGLEAHYHTNPLEPQVIGELLQKHKAEMMACTPTLMRSFLRRCTREQFQHVKWLLLGAEKLKPELQADIQKKLGVQALEGLGCTELSPVVSANVPQDVQTPDGRTVPGHKIGTVGQPVVGTAVAIVDLNTGKLQPRGEKNEGLIFVSGPQVMLGYLHKPDLTASVLQNGWYCTGDIGSVDEDGFVRITDRLSRFAKVGGEMVPMGTVESAIRNHCKVNELAVAITAIPDDARGERLVVIHTPELTQSPAEVTALIGTDLPALWVPKAKDFVKVEKLPVGGTGKLDLRALKEIALAQLS
ncbi:MAG: AMP-binding protein [Candidatus Obscuribacterales bacterium]|nr:AMP-binding protein [Candidatus Obscuribacterales bacterium]